MTDQRGANDTGFRKIVREARLQMQAARSSYYQAKLRGSITRTVRQELAQALLQYYDALWEHKTKRQGVKQAWDESDVDRIPELANETALIEQDTPGDSSNTTQVREQAILTVDPEVLVGLSKQLDSLASDLGFTAGVEEDRPIGRLGAGDKWSDDPKPEAES